jgi:UDP-N-acetylglucosamine 4-epimerase
MTNYMLPYHGDRDLSDYSFLVTGGAGFIGSNLVEYLLRYGARKVRVLDNFSTGFMSNIDRFTYHSNFELIEGDIRDLDTCVRAAAGMDYVLHQAALGSVPRSINDPITTNNVNITGFLNVLMAAKQEKVKRIIYAASSSTYGDSKELPKVEERIGNPLSPYAITKYVNELYARVFAQTYGIETIGLRYFNVFGKRQSPNGAYAAVIPKFISQLMDHQSPVINGDGATSRDFTYIENVIQANIRAVFASNPDAVNQVYNVAYGERTTLTELAQYLKKLLSNYDAAIADVTIEYGNERAGDVKHSLASVEKAKELLDYDPLYSVEDGLREAINWYTREKRSAEVSKL